MNSSGDRVGRWTLLSEVDESGKSFRLHKYKRRTYSVWEAECACGKTIALVYSSNFKNIIAKGSGCARCGCIGRKRHGMSRTSTYSAWAQMIYRCENPKSTAYRYYGGIGVKVCQRWREDFASFLEDMGERPRGLELGRKDTRSDYEPGNCHWVTRGEVQRNKRKSTAQLLRIKKREDERATGTNNP